MSDARILDLADCTQFRQMVEARPPRIVHGSVLVLLALVLTATVWAHLTTADLVVRAEGRVRPISAPVKIISGARAEILSASHAGRVVEVGAREGDQVRKGQLLVRLDTTRLDNDIAACRRRLAAGEEEIERLDKLAELLSREYAVTSQKGQAELANAQEEVRAARERRAAEMRLATEELRHLEREIAVQEHLATKGAVSQEALAEKRQERARAQTDLDKSRLPVNEGQLLVLQQAIDLAARQYEVKREELAAKRSASLVEVETTRIELQNLELERDRSVLRSPIDGVVLSGELHAGDFVQTNEPVMEIAETRGFQFEALVPSQEAGHLRPGMPVRIKLSAYDFQRYGTVNGRVEFIAPDSEVSQEGHVHGYLVRITMPSDVLRKGPFEGRIKLGMAGNAEIVTEQRSMLSILVDTVRRSISLG